MKPLPHQTKFVKNYNGSPLLVHEGGTGKTVCACLWLKDGKDNQALVICPKRVVKKWEETLAKWGTEAVVMSKEKFKKEKPFRYRWSAIVVDEADEFASPLFVPNKRSQLSEALYTFFKTHPRIPRLFLTATPIRSSPWNLHTLLTYMGRYIDFQQWREYFFELTKPAYMPRPAWLPKKNWRKLIVPVLQKHADIVLLQDCVGYLPPVTETNVILKSEPFLNKEEWEGSKAFVEEHKHEQKNKHKKIIEVGKEYRKILVVAHYREQCESLAKELAKDRDTYMIMGGVKNQEAVIKQAQESDECYLVVQASLGAGFDGDSFSCIVFASMSYAVRDFVQMKFRVRRIHNLHPVTYYYLLGGRCDKAVKKNIDLGRDFVPSEWKNV